ncbi:hypothetical protein CARUB_v100031470mg, partial [Capsella rubella]
IKAVSTDASDICGKVSNNGVNKRKREKNFLIRFNLPAPKNLEGSEAMKVNPLPVLEKSHAPHYEAPLVNAAFVSPIPNVVTKTDEDVIVISDDDEEEYTDGLMDISMSRTAKRCIINGIRVKQIPLKKKQI